MTERITAEELRKWQAGAWEDGRSDYGEVFFRAADTLAQLTAERDTLKLEAQIHAGEARAQRATVHECYQAVTQGTGEPADWHGAQPIIAALADLRADVERLKKQQAEHFCIRCHHRWTGDNRTEYCGDCHRASAGTGRAATARL